MVKSVGFDPETETKRMKLQWFVLWSWKDAILKVASFKGRTSRATFLVFIIPLAAAWLGIASWFTTTNMDMTSDLLNKLAKLRLAFGVLTLTFLPALIVRRLHDSANKVVKGFPFGVLGPLGAIELLRRLFFDYDVKSNKHGPPHSTSKHADNPPNQ